MTLVLFSCSNADQIDNHTHNYTSQIVLPTCDEDGYTKFTCKICGDTKNADPLPASGHTFNNYTLNNDATCQKNQTKSSKCASCDKIDTIEIPLSTVRHNYILTVVSPTCTEDGYTLHKCEFCEDSYKDNTVNKKGHFFIKYVSNNNATYEKDATETAKCDRCEVTDTRDIIGSALVHTYKYTNIDATCTEKGYTLRECESCELSFKENYVQALNHSFVNYVNNNDATCLTNETKTAKCVRCEATDTKIEPNSKKEHVSGEWKISRDATCLEAGLKTIKCISCETKLKEEKIDPLGHSFTNYISKNNATYNSNATKVATCPRCLSTDTIVDYGSKLTYDFLKDCKYVVSGAKTYTTVSGLTKSTAVLYPGSSFSYRWAKQDTNKSAKFALTGDITSYDKFVVIMYSEKATGSTMQFCVNCQINSDQKQAYKRFQINVDFVGWKIIEMPFSKFVDGYGADFSKVSNITINASGWSQTPNTIVYIDSIILSKGNVPVIETPNVSDKDYAKIRSSLVSMLNGGISYLEADATQKNKLQSYINAAKQVQNNMRRGNDTPFYADMTSTAGITTNYNNIKTMALGYSIKGSDIYHDPKLKDDILYALDYMHENYYKSKSLHTYTSNNWWDWEIGSAQSLVNILLLMEDTITQSQINKYLLPINSYVVIPSRTMSNRVDLAYVSISSAALQNNYNRLIDSINLLNDTLPYVTKGDGFYTDGSFIQHTVIAYTGSYGPIMLEALSKLVTATSGTVFEFSDEVIITQYRWAVDSFVPLMYKGAMMGLVRGRSIVRTTTDISLGLTAVQGMLRLTEYLSDPTLNYNLKSIIKEYYNYNQSTYKSGLTPYDYEILMSIVNDKDVIARSNDEFTKVFGKMDRSIAQFGNYAVGISMSSARIAKYEAINGENGKGWYTGEGMLYIYINTDDYRPDYWKYVNMYKLPGTTVSLATRQDKNIEASYTLTSCTFVGGSYLDMNMVTAMNFKADANKIGFTSNLTGNKGYFVFENEIVCLGNGLSYSGNDNVETIIENRILDQTKTFSYNGKVLSSKQSTLKDVNYMYIQGYGGIYMPTKRDVILNRPSNGVSFIELSINHGNNFTNETYEYVILPLKTSSETEAYSKNPNVQILVNDTNVSAVKDKKNNVTEYIFWKKGTYTIDGNSITVDNPCTVIITNNKISLSDPTQKISTIKLTLNSQVYTFSGLKDGGSLVLSK